MNVVDLCAVVPFFVMVSVLPVVDVRALARTGATSPTAGRCQATWTRATAARGPWAPWPASSAPCASSASSGSSSALADAYGLGVAAPRLGRYSTGLKMMMVALGTSTASWVRRPRSWFWPLFPYVWARLAIVLRCELVSSPVKLVDLSAQATADRL